MNWTTHFEDDYFKIESNSTPFFPDTPEDNVWRFYTWEKSFIRVTFKNLVKDKIKVDGILYQAYVPDELLLSEMTDRMRVTNDSNQHTIYITEYNDVAITTIDYYSTTGERPSGINIDRLPDIIPFNNSGGNPFYFQTSENMQKFNGTSWVFGYEPYQQGNAYTELSYLSIRTTPGGVYTSFVDLGCWSDKVLVEWLGHFGIKKSWWFTVERVINGSDKQLSLQTNDNGYNVLKNKKVSMQVVHKKADQVTQRYLSDITMSDEVYVYDGTEKNRVKVDTNSSDITVKKKDVQLLINVTAYDTI